MTDSATTLSVDTDEKELFAIKLPPYFGARVASGFIIIDGLLHIAQSFGFLLTTHGAGIMSMAQFQGTSNLAHATALNWMALGWGILILFIGLALWRHFRKLREANA